MVVHLMHSENAFDCTVLSQNESFLSIESRSCPNRTASVVFRKGFHRSRFDCSLIFTALGNERHLFL